ncbi:M48 family peptidase [Maritimibacter sp. 55A14]|uniref:M48 family metallopeptidase n=1 Tax=Maritimibacter sp. 55A14 TaxID=2174844 RepID=UPI000D61E1F2|nr:SprT family zinc-dependent metalloprotease [Maritimibacter sp. 55A14]PWE29247.1 M48 family peptidase [Maritimibacter sp. 55A14]
MAQLTLHGDPPIEVALRRSARAKRLSLRVSALDGRVTLTLPLRVPEREAHAFAREKESWLRGHLDARPAQMRPVFGGVLPVDGHPLPIRPGTGRAARVEEGAIMVPGAEAELPVRLRALLQSLARERLIAASDRHAQALGRRYSRISLRDPRSRWGSCSAAGGLMYSWRLVMAPPEVLDYVAAHEVAHLAQMNHSPAFWAVVARLCPGYEAPRRWLRREGAGLHRYVFEKR